MVGPIRKQRHRNTRLAWVRARHRWRLHTWQHIIFSDESRFSLRFSDGRYRVYRSSGERFTDQCVYESDRFGGGSVMVWAGICHDGRTQPKIVQGKLNAVKYRDVILDPTVLPFLQQRNFDNIFQHDIARCHVGRVCQDFLNQNHIRVLHWPALAPNLSPIEHLWDELGRRVPPSKPPETLQELREELVHEWNNIPQAFIQRFIGSMRRRCEDVIAARGGHTRCLTPQTSILHDNFCLSMICFDNDIANIC